MIPRPVCLLLLLLRHRPPFISPGRQGVGGRSSTCSAAWRQSWLNRAPATVARSRNVSLARESDHAIFPLSRIYSARDRIFILAWATALQEKLQRGGHCTRTQRERAWTRDEGKPKGRRVSPTWAARRYIEPGAAEFKQCADEAERKGRQHGGDGHCELQSFPR